LRAAQTLPDRIAAARAAGEKRRQEQAAEWEALARELPPRIDALVARLGLLVSGGWISSERQAATQAEIVSLNQGWAAASATAERGELASATEAARVVEARSRKLASAIGLKLAPAPIAASAPSPSPQPSASPTSALTPTPAATARPGTSPTFAEPSTAPTPTPAPEPEATPAPTPTEPTPTPEPTPEPTPTPTPVPPPVPPPVVPS
jgi:hypothetical protein